MRVDRRECGGDPYHRETRRATPHRHVQLRRVGGSAEPLGGAGAGAQRVPHLRAAGVVLETRQSVAAEFRVAAHASGGVDEGHPTTELIAQRAGGVGPARGVGGKRDGHEARLVLQLGGFTCDQPFAQEALDRDQQSRHRDRHQKHGGDEEAGGEPHRRRRLRSTVSPERKR